MKYCYWALLVFVSCGKAVTEEADDANPQAPVIPVPSFSQLGTINLTITFDTPPSSAVADIAPIKYNKQAIFNIEWDDNTRTALTAHNILKNYYYTDGTGRARPYTAAIGINGLSTLGDEIGYMANSINYHEYLPLIEDGWDLMNHSLRHKDKPDIADYTQDMWELNDLYHRRIYYVPNCFIVPTNYFNYVPEAEQMGFLVSSSTGHNPYKPKHPAFDQVGNIKSFENEQGFIQLNRDFTDQWDNAAVLADTKDKFGDMVTRSNDSTCMFYRVGTHSIDSANFVSLMDYCYNKANDKVWFTTAREWMEYRLVKSKVIVNSQLVGNTLTITLDYSNLPKHLRWGDVTLNLNSDASISQVTATGDVDGVTFDATSGQINVYKEVRYQPVMNLP